MTALHRNFFNNFAPDFLCQLLHLGCCQGAQLFRAINAVEYSRQRFPPIFPFTPSETQSSRRGANSGVAGMDIKHFVSAPLCTERHTAIGGKPSIIISTQL